MIRYLYKVILLALALTWLQPVNAALPDFTPLVKKHSASVVNISTTRKAHPNIEQQLFPEDVPPPFQHFFRHFFNEDGMGMGLHDVRSLGSGLIVSSDGYVLTNDHVIRGADEIVVRLNDQREFDARVVGEDKGSDLALLRIQAKNLPAAALGDSDKLEVGEWVLAIGSPFGFDHSVTAGIVSAKGRNLSNDRYVPFIQTDVAINPGNSGGPLFNMAGEVVGINAQIISRSGGYLGLSFAVPSNVVKTVMPQLKETGFVARGWLGISFQALNRGLAKSFGLNTPKGALVAKVIAGAPADKGGIRPGDIILAFNGKEVSGAFDLPAMVGSHKAGDTVTIKVWRKRKMQTLKVTLGQLPSDKARHQKHANAQSALSNRLGMTVRPLTPDEQRHLEVTGGVRVMGVEPGPANKAGIAPGDIIYSINLQPISSVDAFHKVLKVLPKQRPVPILTQRPGQPEQYITVVIE